MSTPNRPSHLILKLVLRTYLTHWTPGAETLMHYKQKRARGQLQIQESLGLKNSVTVQKKDETEGWRTPSNSVFV